MSRSLFSVANQDGAAILDVHHGTITTLNETGAFVWQELERGVALDGIAVRLADLTGQDAATILGDLRDFKELLRVGHLLSE